MSREELVGHLERTGLSPAWLARRLKVSRTAVWRWTSGRAPIPEDRAEEIFSCLGYVPTNPR